MEPATKAVLSSVVRVEYCSSDNLRLREQHRDGYLQGRFETHRRCLTEYRTNPLSRQFEHASCFRARKRVAPFILTLLRRFGVATSQVKAGIGCEALLAYCASFEYLCAERNHNLQRRGYFDCGQLLPCLRVSTSAAIFRAKRVELWEIVAL